MNSRSNFNYHYRVESLAKPVPSIYRPDKSVDRYVHIVAFNDPKDHEEKTRDYLRYYCRVDPDSDDSRLRGLSRDHFLCANAILTYYLRSAINRRIEVDTPSQPVSESELPNTEPVFQTETSAIWLVSREEDIHGLHTA
jgi:hypothetical protein